MIINEIIFQSFLKIYLFIYFWLHWVFIAAHGFSLVAANGSYSSQQCTGFSLQCVIMPQSTSSTVHGFNSCGTQAQLLRSRWNLSGPGIKQVSPALVSRFLTTGPPRNFPSTKSWTSIQDYYCQNCIIRPNSLSSIWGISIDKFLLFRMAKNSLKANLYSTKAKRNTKIYFKMAMHYNRFPRMLLYMALKNLQLIPSCQLVFT